MPCTEDRSRVYHVSPFGSNTPPYDTYAKAAHIPHDAALATTGAGDTVFVHAGSYDVDTTIDLPEGVALMGVGRDSVSLVYRGRLNAAFTIYVAGNNEFSGVEFINPLGNGAPQTLAILQNLGTGDLSVHDCAFDMAGIASLFARGSHEIFDNNFIVNNGTGGIAADAGTVRIHDNFFLGVGGLETGFGVRTAGGDVLIEHNIFDYHGGGLNPVFVDRFPFGAIVRNNLIIGGQWAIIWNAHDGIIENNTIVGPTTIADGGIAIGVRTGDTVVVRNNALVDFAAVPAFGSLNDGRVEYTYNALWPDVDSLYRQWYGDPSDIAVVDSENFIGFPMFADGSLFHLQYGSPLIDAGEPSILDIDGSRSDVGWTGGPYGTYYEFLDLSPLPPETLRVMGEDTLVSVHWSSRPETDLSGYRLYRGFQSGFWMPGLTAIDEFDATTTNALDYISSDTYRAYYVVTAFDRTGHESAPTPEAAVIP